MGNDPNKKKWTYQDLQQMTARLAVRPGGGVGFLLKGLDQAGFKGWNTQPGQAPAGPRAGGPSSLSTDYQGISSGVGGPTTTREPSIAGDASKYKIGEGETSGAGSFMQARQSAQGYAEDLFNRYTAHKSFEGVSGERSDVSGYNISNVSKINPRSGKHFLGGINWDRFNNPEGNFIRSESNLRRINKYIRGKADLALHGREETHTPIFMKDGVRKHQKDVDFNPFPNYDFSQKIHTPKGESVVTNPKSGKKKKKKKSGIGLGGFLNPLNPIQYAATFLTGNKYKRRDMEARGYMSIVGKQTNPLQTYRGNSGW
tara:strand:- start:498 stop:1439 length:942 start_codon:yes stop_codon:yes gene_type:complete